MVVGKIEIDNDYNATAAAVVNNFSGKYKTLIQTYF